MGIPRKLSGGLLLMFHPWNALENLILSIGLQGSKLEVQQNGLLGVGGLGLLGCLLGLWPSLLGLLGLLGWAAAEAGELAWEYWKVHSEPGVLYLGTSLPTSSPTD